MEQKTNAEAGPVERPVRPASEAFHNPWRTKLESCMVDGERLSYGEWQDLISETDDLYRYRCGQHDALNVAYANGRDDEREEASERVNSDAYRCIAPACKPLGCSDCNCAVPADVYAALGRAFSDAERERCAKLCDVIEEGRFPDGTPAAGMAAECAWALREGLT